MKRNPCMQVYSTIEASEQGRSFYRVQANADRHEKVATEQGVTKVKMDLKKKRRPWP